MLIYLTFPYKLLKTIISPFDTNDSTKKSTQTVKHSLFREGFGKHRSKTKAENVRWCRHFICGKCIP